VEEENKKTRTKEKQQYLLLDAAPSAVTADAGIFAAIDRHADTQLIFVRRRDDQLGPSSSCCDFFTWVHQLHNNTQSQLKSSKF
jgi:hypothetical protein